MSKYPLFHNTTELSGDDLYQALRSARTLMGMVERFYKIHHTRGFSPDEIRDSFISAGIAREEGYPITSYRAIITKLQKDGKLRKIKDWAPTKHGRRSHRWKWGKEDNDQIGIKHGDDGIPREPPF